MIYYNLPCYATSDDYQKAAEYYVKHGDKTSALDMMERAIKQQQDEYKEQEYHRQFRNYWGDFFDD